MEAVPHRVTAKLRRLRFDAGALCLNFVATLGRRRGEPVERLDSPARLAEWFAVAGLPATGTFDPELLAAARDVREAMYRLLVAVTAGSPVDVDALDLVNRYATAPVPAVRLARAERGVRAVWPAAGLSPSAGLAVVAADLVRHLGDEHWLARLQTCAAGDCGMFYLDASRGGRRRWCSMEYCGNRAKAAGHRARQLAR